MHSTRWIESPAISYGELTPERIAESQKLPLWLARALLRRMESWQEKTFSACEKFLKPSLKDLPDPFSVKDMRLAAEHISEAIQGGAQIGIYGDYDVDGTVGSALLRRFFRSLGVEPIVYQPDRSKEGYGINADAIRYLAEECGVELLISVDCGISSVKEITIANELGMDVIICDHHETPDPMPPAFAILDHKRRDETSSIRSLCGTGMAFYLAMAVRAVLRDAGFFSDELKEPDLRNYLDMVAVATIADMVPLVEENHILTVFGLEKLKRSPMLGLSLLCEVAGVKREEISAYHIGFVLGPRINASGRLQTAGLALELLSTDNPEEAANLAKQLHDLNAERAEVQLLVVEEALKQAEEQVAKHGKNLPALLLVHDEWHEGVIGIVASRVMEVYHRPVAVLTFATHSGHGKSSLRSISPVNIVEVLRECDSHLLGYGGHKAAAGFSIERGKLEDFRKDFLSAVEKRLDANEVMPEKEIQIDDALGSIKEVNIAAIEQMQKIGPFGIGNPEPILSLSRCKLKNIKIFKDTHIKATFISPTGESIDGFWANGASRFRFKENDLVDIAFSPQISTFRGAKNVELRVRDIK